MRKKPLKIVSFTALSFLFLGASTPDIAIAADPTPVATGAPQSTATFGVSNVTFTNQAPKSKESFTIEFAISRPISPDQKYRVQINFTSARDSFSGVADLYEGNYSNGKWRSVIAVPANIYSDSFSVTFIPIGTQENNKANLSTVSKNVILNITGLPVPVPPLIEVVNIKTDKQIYLGGSIIHITFDTRILAGNPNEETTDPEVLLWDNRFNSFSQPTTNRGKPIVASGSYGSGKWTLDYALQPNMLTTTAQVYVRTPQGLDSPELTTKGPVIQIQGLVNEVVISNIKFDKATYEPNSKVRVTFSTTSTETTLNAANKPFIILTDLEYSDYSEQIATSLISGTINSGEWSAEFNAPELTRYNPPRNSYLLGFYNSAGTIRDLGPALIIRKSQSIKLKQPIGPVLELGSKAVDYQVTSLSALPIATTVLTPVTCKIEEGKLFPLAVGKCEINSSAGGDEQWAEEKLSTTVVISAQKTLSITCFKGKSTKKVTAVKPACPPGYKKK
jgi:hypothetical protein